MENKDKLIEKARKLGLYTRELRGEVRPTGMLCMHHGWTRYGFEACSSERARFYGDQVMGILPGFPVFEDMQKLNI